MAVDLLDDAMTPVEFMAALRIKPATYYKYQKLGRLDRFRLVPRIGPPRYSRAVVKAYLDRAPLPGLRVAKGA